MNIPVISSYTEFQQHLGYCKLLLSVSRRAASQPEQILRQLDHILFKPTPDDKYTYLGHILGKPVQGKQSRSHLQTQTPLKEVDDDTSHRTYGNEAKEIFSLCRALGLLDERVVILENAMPLLRLIPEASWELMRQASGPASYNPMMLDHGTNNVSEKTFFLLRLISSDAAFTLLPVALCSMNRTEFHRYVDWDGMSTDDFPERNMLTVVYEDLILAPKPRFFAEVRNARELESYFLGDPRKRRAHPGLRQYARFRHQATPRLEFLKQLGILAAHGSASYSYSVTDTTRAYAEFLRATLLTTGLDIEAFVRKHAFKLASVIYGRTLRGPVDQEEVFRFFLRAYAQVKRDIGNTPAMSICVRGALLAQDESVLIEIDELYEVGRDYARKYSEFLRYSGGSAQVGDYLISVDHRLLRQFTIQHE